jgi:uncharacterized membrane protein
MIIRRDKKVLYSLIASTISFTVFSQLLIKAGMVEVGTLPTQMDAIPLFFINSLTNPKVILGLTMAIMAALTWIGAASMSDLNYIIPFVSLTIVLVLVLSGILFGEQIPTNRWFGVIMVCLGLIVAAWN